MTMSRTTSSGSGDAAVNRIVPLDSSKAVSWSRTASTTRELNRKMLRCCLAARKASNGFWLYLSAAIP